MKIAHPAFAHPPWSRRRKLSTNAQMTPKKMAKTKNNQPINKKQTDQRIVVSKHKPSSNRMRHRPLRVRVRLSRFGIEGGAP